MPSTLEAPRPAAHRSARADRLRRRRRRRRAAGAAEVAAPTSTCPASRCRSAPRSSPSSSCSARSSCRPSRPPAPTSRTGPTSPARPSCARRSTSGEIDLYYEYTGTGWITILGETEPVPGAQEQFDAVKEADAANDITWFARAEANNTFAIAANAEAVEEFGVETLSDYAEVVNEDPSAGRLCSSAEFINRDDGLPGVEQTYGFDLPDDQVVQLEPALVYTQVGAGEDCDFAVVFATDGQIENQDLTVLEDDEQFFPPYNLAVAMRTEAYEANSEPLEELFGTISGELTDDKLIELNGRVDVDGEAPADVAADFLSEIGIA